MKKMYVCYKKYFSKKLAMGMILGAVIFAITGCSTVKKIEKREKVDQTVVEEQKVTDMYFEKKSIAQVRKDALTLAEEIGTDKSRFANCREIAVEPFITENDEIYKLSLEKLDGNDLSNGKSIGLLVSSQTDLQEVQYYRNNKGCDKVMLSISGKETVRSLIQDVEAYMKKTYSDSPFEWLVERLDVMSKSGKDYVNLHVRPSYDGIPFAGVWIVNDGRVPNMAKDFRTAIVGVTESGKIYSYEGISPYYRVEKQGELITEIMTLDSAMSVITKKMGEDVNFWIENVELTYRLGKDMQAVPIWNMVVLSGKGETKFQIDVENGELYYE